MIKMLETAPSSVLMPYVRSFMLREFDTAGHPLCKPLHAVHEIYMTFFLNTETPLPANFSGTDKWKFIYGLQTYCQGVLEYNGYIRSFSIVFRPNGFYRLFGLPQALFTDATFSAADILTGDIDRLQLQLQEAPRFSHMVSHAETFLLAYLKKAKAKDPHNSIQATSNLLLRHWGNVSVERLACDANMSMKTFERNFTAQVGLPPKLYARVTRFNAALQLKLRNDKQDWTSIAHHCGYYDQMHFIKDFKAFAGGAPSQFFKNTPPPKEDVETR